MPTEPGQAAGLPASHIIVHRANYFLIASLCSLLPFILFLCCASSYTGTVYFMGQGLNLCCLNHTDLRDLRLGNTWGLPSTISLCKRECIQMLPFGREQGLSTSLKVCLKRTVSPTESSLRRCLLWQARGDLHSLPSCSPQWQKHVRYSAGRSNIAGCEPAQLWL